MDCWLGAGRGSGGAGEGEFDDDEDTAKGMARLFCEVGEAYMSLIVTAVQEVRRRARGEGVGAGGVWTCQGRHASDKHMRKLSGHPGVRGEA